MWEDILQLAYANGLWAVLFLGLFIYQLSDSAKREQKYYDIIENLSDSLKVVESINEKVDDIEEKINQYGLINPENQKKLKENKDVSNNINEGVYEKK
jgi:hypothetical protein